MPALTEVEFAALKESLREHGCLVAVEYDEDGNVLDGHHRLRAMRELGIKTHPRVVRAGLGGHAEKVSHALALNLHRRHLNPKQRAEAVLRLCEAGWSVRRIATETGIPRSTVSRDLQGSADAGPVVVVGADGKTYAARQTAKPTTVYVHSDRQQRTAEDALRVLGDESPGKTVELRRLERLRRHKNARVGREALASEPGSEAGVDLRCLAIADLEIEAGTVDIVLTDPPYSGAECWHDGGPWDTLGRQAALWLKPGGLLLAYTGNMHVARSLEVLGRYEPDGLAYWWLCAVTFPGGSGRQVRPGQAPDEDAAGVALSR